MEVLDLFTSWFLSAWRLIAHNVFNEWGFFGNAIFSFILIRKLIKIFGKTF